MMEHFGIYVIITSPVLPHSTIAEKCVKHGIKMLQLREKHLPDNELIRIGKEIRSITKGSDTRFVINDRPDIAAICEADYLHLGQNDMSISDARKVTGNIKTGLSTHSIGQAQKAILQKPDYIGFGPVYSTNAKAIPDPPVGTEWLKQVIALSNIPVVAIGGIFPENLGAVLEAGATNFALVRYFMQSHDLDERIRLIKNILEDKK